MGMCRQLFLSNSRVRTAGMVMKNAAVYGAERKK